MRLMGLVAKVGAWLLTIVVLVAAGTAPTSARSIGPPSEWVLRERFEIEMPSTARCFYGLAPDPQRLVVTATTLTRFTGSASVYRTTYTLPDGRSWWLDGSSRWYGGSSSLPFVPPSGPLGSIARATTTCKFDAMSPVALGGFALWPLTFSPATRARSAVPSSLRLLDADARDSRGRPATAWGYAGYAGYADQTATEYRDRAGKWTLETTALGHPGEAPLVRVVLIDHEVVRVPIITFSAMKPKGPVGTVGVINVPDSWLMEPFDPSAVTSADFIAMWGDPRRHDSAVAAARRFFVDTLGFRAEAITVRHVVSGVVEVSTDVGCRYSVEMRFRRPDPSAASGMGAYLAGELERSCDRPAGLTRAELVWRGSRIASQRRLDLYAVGPERAVGLYRNEAGAVEDFELVGWRISPPDIDFRGP